MKLKTSYFNSAVLKKDITRFAPAWGIYMVFTLLYVVLLWGDNFYSIDETFRIMASVNLVYAGLCAVLLFGDLFNARLCNALHAMPMRREGWYVTHLVAGLLFSIVPNAVGTVIAAILLEQMGHIAFLWLAAATLEYLFFFGLAVFCVMCAGNRLGAAAIYALVNFFSILVAWLIDTFCSPVLYGVVLDMSKFADFSPVVPLTAERFLKVRYDALQVVNLERMNMPQWYYVFIVAAVGAAFLGLGLLIYRKRNLETAGDFISLKPAAPVFSIVYTLCVGAAFYLVAELFNSDLEYSFLVIGLFVGFFTGKMLVDKRVRVFQKKNLLRAAIFVFCFFATIAIVRMDPFRITTFIPKAENVSSVSFGPYSDNFGYDRNEIVVSKQEDIENILQVHQHCLDNRDENGTPITIAYKMKSGVTVTRQYYVVASTDAGQILNGYYSSVKHLLNTEDVQDLLGRITYIEYNSYDGYGPLLRIQPFYTGTGVLRGEQGVIYNFASSLKDQEVGIRLLEAIERDCQAGTLTQLWDYHSNGEVLGWMYITYRTDKGHQEQVDLTLYSNSVNTMSCINSLLADE